MSEQTTPETDALLSDQEFDCVSWDDAAGELADLCSKLERERDEARVQYRSTEALAMALVKTIDELKTEKAELFVKLVNLQSGSRRATLDEIAESVRDKYDPEYEREGMDNE